MNELIVALYDIAAFAGALLLVHVITQAENDLHLNRTDRPLVRKARKISFYSDAAFLLLTICLQNYWLVNPTTISVGVVVILQIFFGGAILAINVISLRERAPPSAGHRTRDASYGSPSFISRLISYLIRPYH